MAEFKGTKGKFKYEHRNDNYYIHKEFSPSFYREFIGQMFYLKNTDGTFNKEAEYNALLVSKAPEMLEMLIHISSSLQEVWDNEDGDNVIFDYLNAQELDKLIKEATEI